jgi:hypothetical protein
MKKKDKKRNHAKKRGIGNTKRMSTTSRNGKVREGNPFFAFRADAALLSAFVSKCGDRTRAAEYLRGCMRQHVGGR